MICYNLCGDLFHNTTYNILILSASYNYDWLASLVVVLVICTVSSRAISKSHRKSRIDSIGLLQKSLIREMTFPRLQIIIASVYQLSFVTIHDHVRASRL